MINCLLMSNNDEVTLCNRGSRALSHLVNEMWSTTRNILRLAVEDDVRKDLHGLVSQQEELPRWRAPEQQKAQQQQ